MGVHTVATGAPARRPRMRQWDLLLIVTGAPYGSDMLTTALRLAQAVLRRGGSVRIWACGYTTMVTQTPLGEVKPPNLQHPDRPYPSMPTVVRQLLAGFPGRVGWIGCTACSGERGATHHIEEVRLRSPARFAATIAASGRTVFIGGA
jgi:sulfur relay (sulfurtransferase) complex TusBCD TusD component (DsrE family)